MNNSSINNEIVEAYFYWYISVGAIAVLSNCLVILVLLINKTLFINSAFVIGLALGDTFDGVALLGIGATRLYRAVNKIAPFNVHPFQCMLYLTPMFLIGNQIPGFMFALIGLERYLAVGHFDWYYAKWTPGKAWLCLSGAYSICAVVLTTSFLYIYFQPDSAAVSNLCTTPLVMGQSYSFYNYGVSVVGGSVAVATTLVAMVIFTKRKRQLYNQGHKDNNPNHMLTYIRSQWRHTVNMFCIAILDFGLVVLPNFLIVLNNVLGGTIATNLGSKSLITVAARSCVNLLIYLICNQDFQKTALKACGFKKCTNTVSTNIGTTKKGAFGVLLNRTRKNVIWASNSHGIEEENKF